MVYIMKKPIIGDPIGFENLTKIKGDPIRHIEQLWDEVKKLREEIRLLKKKNNG